METSLLIALATFAFISTVTPGPNNMMLLASGAQYGYKRSLPHMVGIVIGVAGLMISTLLGIGALFNIFPVLYSPQTDMWEKKPMTAKAMEAFRTYSSEESPMDTSNTLLFISSMVYRWKSPF